MTSTTLKLQKKLEVVSLPVVNWKVLFIVGLIMMSIFLVFYVLQVNNMMKNQFIINSYDKKINQLSQENKNLQISFAEGSYMGQILQKAQNLNFEKVTSVKYIQVLENTFTAAK